jgi:hypothetical protein
MTQKLPNYDVGEGEEELISGTDGNIKLPNKKDTLFVTRKIDKYEPYKNLNTKFKV